MDKKQALKNLLSGKISFADFARYFQPVTVHFIGKDVPTGKEMQGNAIFIEILGSVAPVTCEADITEPLPL